MSFFSNSVPPYEPEHAALSGAAGDAPRAAGCSREGHGNVCYIWMFMSLGLAVKIISLATLLILTLLLRHNGFGCSPVFDLTVITSE